MTRRTAKDAATLLNTRAHALRRAIPGAIGGDETSVHRSRVASRRLREALPVFAAGLKRTKSSKAARKIRKLTRALGTVRELDVTLGLIDELSGSDDLSRPALQDVRLHVAAERDRHREAMLARLASVDLDKLGRRLHTTTEVIAQQPADTWRETLAARLLKRAKRLAEAIDAAGQLYATEQLHQVRIAAKKLRYGLELAADGGTKAAVPLVASLKRVQGTLGKLHDLQVLQEHVSAVQAAAPGTVAPPEGLAAIAGRIEERCRVLHGRYVKAIPDLRLVTEAVRLEVVPQLAARKHPLKMSLGRSRRAAGGAR